MRKSNVFVALAIFVAFSVCGCTAKVDKLQEIAEKDIAGEEQISGKFRCIDGNAVCSEWVDTETGVHYFYTYSGGLTPRLLPDGSPVVEEAGE